MNFQKLFGLDQSLISSRCIIMPSNDRGLFLDAFPGKLHKGLFFDVVENPMCSLVTLKNRWLAGDCVLYLSETRCEELYLFGSCGALQGELGDKVIISGSYDLESFTGFLNSTDMHDSTFVKSSRRLMEELIAYYKGDIKQYRCATISSFYLEHKKRDILQKMNIDCVDMEASMFFSAAKKQSMESVALFYVTDIIAVHPFDENYDRVSRQRINASRKKIAQILIGYLG